MHELIWFSIPGAILVIGSIINMNLIFGIEWDLIKKMDILVAVLIPMTGFLIHAIYRLIYEKSQYAIGKYRLFITYIANEVGREIHVEITDLKRAFLVWQMTFYSEKIDPVFREHNRRCWDYIHAYWCSACAFYFLLITGVILEIIFYSRKLSPYSYLNWIAWSIWLIFLGIESIILYYKGVNTYQGVVEEEREIVHLNKKVFQDNLAKLEAIPTVNKRRWFYDKIKKMMILIKRKII